MKSEIIDFDEHETGERLEGAHLACWNVASKLAGGLSIGVIGWVLAWVGFDRDAPEQTLIVKQVMVGLTRGLPLVCHPSGRLAGPRQRGLAPERGQFTQ